MMTKPPSRISQDPEEIALAALSYIVEDASRLGRFLDITGLNPTTIREAAANHSFLAAVLDYVCTNEVDLIAFATQNRILPKAVTTAQATLSRSGQSSETF